MRNLRLGGFWALNNVGVCCVLSSDIFGRLNICSPPKIKIWASFLFNGV